MQVTVERRPGSVVELSIEVPTERVERAIERAYNSLAPRVRVPGFRPGKAPRNILEREIGWAALREQALEMIIPEVVGEAVEEQKLQAIENPRVAIEQFERLQPARLKALVTVKPDVRLPNYGGIKVPLKPVVVDEARVAESLEGIRAGYAELVPADNRPVQANDQVVIDLEVLRDGVAVDDQPTTDQALEVNQESLIPGLFEGLQGISQGETREIPLTLPEDYRRTELAGQPVVFKVTVKEIKEKVLPPLDDELARLTGAGDTLAELRTQVEQRLQVAMERDASFAHQKAALDQLVAGSEFEVPEVMVEDEIDREIRNLAMTLEQQGIDFERFLEFGGGDLAKMREERRENAVDRVRQELVLDALADAEKIEPSPEHIHAEAHATVGDSPDAERLVHSERVYAYVRERLRLQWSLLWLAASARGEPWTPPEPATLTYQEPASAAAEEILNGDGSGEPPAEPPAEPAAEPAVPGESQDTAAGPVDDGGMVEL